MNKNLTPRNQRIAYKWRPEGIRAYDSLKGTNISEQMMWDAEAVAPALTTNCSKIRIIYRQ